MIGVPRGVGALSKILAGAAIWAALLWLLAACGAPQVPPSGFLSDYPRLRPDASQEGLAWWEDPGVSWGRYRRLLIEPVEVRPAPSPEAVPVSAEEQARLAVSLRRAVVQAVAGRYAVVDGPGPDVLRVRAALTHLKPVTPTMNVISTAMLLWPLDVGEAALEAQFLDSRSGRVLGELSVASRGSTLELGQVWTRWGQVEAAFADWARRFAQALQEDAQTR